MEDDKDIIPLIWQNGMAQSILYFYDKIIEAY